MFRAGMERLSLPLDTPTEGMRPQDAAGALALVYLKLRVFFCEAMGHLKSMKPEAGFIGMRRKVSMELAMRVADEVAERRMMHTLRPGMEPEEGFALRLPGIAGQCIYSWPELAHALAEPLDTEGEELQGFAESNLGFFGNYVLCTELALGIMLAEQVRAAMGIYTAKDDHDGGLSDPTPASRRAMRSLGLTIAGHTVS